MRPLLWLSILATTAVLTTVIGANPKYREADIPENDDDLPEFLRRKRSVTKGANRNRRDAMSVILEQNEEMLDEDGDDIFIEGDIFLGQRGSANALRDKNKLWPNGVVPYTIVNTFSDYMKSLIQEAFRHYQERTCIRFVERTNEDDYIQFKPLSGCWSSVGRDTDRQRLSLGEGCNTLGTVIHEIMHALGFYHEQSRTDRDEYVTIVEDNVEKDNLHNFETYDHTHIDALGAPYDYKSVMHYDSKAFSKNDKATIVPKEDVGLIDRNYFSKWDLYKINKLYNCGMTGLETKVLPGNGECYEGRIGLDYRGTVSTTKSGKTCQNWSTAYTEADYDRITLVEMGLLDNNYCRNPDYDSKGPWCYYTTGRYEYCDVGNPGENCLATSPGTPFPTIAPVNTPPPDTRECFTRRNGYDYRGIKATTTDGQPCINWDSVGLDYVGNHNYCRNPDKDNTVWCYYNSDYEWGYCDIGRKSQQC
ncbi:uncharacterized protein LOC144440770 [Glandiceps talaboti]